MPVKPLQNITVLDLTKFLTGNYCSMALADYGAEVIKVERPGAYDPVRDFKPQKSAGLSYWHALLNRGKKSLCLDFKRPAGREALIALVKKADVLIESFRPGVMDSMGIGFDDLKNINPRLIYCVFSGYGRCGADSRAHDLNIMGLSGLSYYDGTGEPFQGGAQIAGITGALWGAFAILAALQARAVTGRGQLVDAPLINAALSLLPVSISGYWGELDTGLPMYPRRTPNYCHYRTKDGKYLAVGANEPKLWRRLCEIIGVSDIAPVEDIKNHPALFERLGGIFGQKDLKHWEGVFAGEDICVTPVRGFKEMMAGPLLTDSGMLLKGDRQLNCPARLTETPGAPQGPARRLGADSVSVLREVGGFLPEEIEKLLTDGVLRQD